MAKGKSHAKPEPSRMRVWGGRLLRVGAAATVVTGIGGVVGLAVAGYQYKVHVVDHPGEHLERGHIRSIISQESPVYYRDGKTRVGVFFEDEHRQAVGYPDLPLAWQMGIVAAEDGDYWSHFGISPKHIARAMWVNVQSGSVVAGGSTLTQQTAKNLYYRPDRSFKSKLNEFVNALRLEAHYDKAEILTFYANQFHVTGNGRGLGIGARYFFDKNVEDLTTTEAAFLAGLVKAPSRYDPFLGDADRRKRAVEKAHERTRYVLRRIVEEPLDNTVPPSDSDAEYQSRVQRARAVREEARKALESGFELEFRRGTFRYDSSAVLDEVARRLAEPPFDDVLAQAGIEDPSTAGLVVVTTLDPEAQRAAEYGLWHHLTEAGALMEAPTPADLIVDARPPRFDPDRVVVPREFRLARVKSHVEDPKRHLVVDLGGRDCVVDRDSVVRAAVAIRKGAEKSAYAKASTAEVDAVVDALPVDSVVRVSVREHTEAETYCDLEWRPELQGAVTVLRHGEIVAMVGGNDNKNFNRATAQRQMGSTWKPLVFHAALQLGWRPDDLLDNRRGVFPFSTTFYYPRPDHEPDDVVSMSWAGVKSENLASIWLLYHLTDRLNAGQVAALAKELDLARREGEGEQEYRKRIQEAGVLPTRGRVQEQLFLQARAEVYGTMAQQAHPEDALGVASVHFGWNFDEERARVQRREGGKTRARKLRALRNDFRAMLDRADQCAAQHLVLDMALQTERLPASAAVSDLTVMVDREGDEPIIRVACGEIPEGYVPVDQELLEEVQASLAQRPLAVLPGLTLPGVRAEPALRLAPVADMLVDERLHVSSLVALRDAWQRQKLTYELAGDDAPDLYDPELLYWHQDFRVLLSLKYLARLARQYGVQSELNEVLSLPLGASENTLEESVAVYQALMTGKVWTYPGKTGLLSEVPTPERSTLLIRELRDVDGNVLYRAEPEAEQSTPAVVGELSADILRNVVRWGTGRRALDAVQVGGAAVPLGGKTGTTNDFKNAAFVGFAPMGTSRGYDVGEGYAVGAYVGYDDNRPMVNGNAKLAGASGALPAWIGTIRGMELAGLLGEAPAVEPEAGAWPLVTSAETLRVAADVEAGGAALSAAAYTPETPSILVPLPSVVEVEPVDFDEISARPVRVFPRTDAPRPQPERRRGLWRRRGRE